VISAFIKSLRGSDPDAAVYWLQTMIAAGEDPKFIARRMIIFASEDVGIASERALGLAVDAFRALEVVGLPEANFALTHAAIGLAVSPKSNTVKRAIAAASAAVEGTSAGEVPAHLRSGATQGDREFGLGVGYRYPHDEDVGVVRQQYLPDGLEREIFVRLKSVGDESTLAERLDRIDRILGKPPRA